MSDTSRNGLAALSGTLLGIAIATVALRFQARYRQKATLQVDDWLMVPALVSPYNHRLVKLRLILTI